MLLIGTGQFLTVLKVFVQLPHGLIHPVNFAAITAEQIVAQIQPVLHHLEPDVVGVVGHLQRLTGGGFGAVLALHRNQVH